MRQRQHEQSIRDGVHNRPFFRKVMGFAVYLRKNEYNRACENDQTNVSGIEEPACYDPEGEWKSQL